MKREESYFRVVRGSREKLGSIKTSPVKINDHIIIIEKEMNNPNHWMTHLLLI